MDVFKIFRGMQRVLLIVLLLSIVVRKTSTNSTEKDLRGGGQITATNESCNNIFPFIKAATDGYDTSMSFSKNFYTILGIICPESVYCGANDTSGNSSVLKYSLDDNTNFPDLYTCNKTRAVSEAHLYLQNNAQFLTGRCMPCSCTDDCIEKQNCCPVINNVHNSQFMTERQIPQECVYADIKSYDSTLDATYSKTGTISKSYHMVADCFSKTFSEDIATKCRRPNKEHLEQIIPVVSNKKDINYKNNFCAECNEDYDVTPWTMVVTFNDLLTLTGAFKLPTTLKQLMPHIDNPRMINILYEPPEKVLSSINMFACSAFDNDIYDCTDTARMPELYNAQRDFFQHACLMRGHKYIAGRNTFDNVFCYLCKNDDKCYSSKACGMVNKYFESSFSAILKPEALKTDAKRHVDVANQDSPCSCTEYHYRNKKTCRQLVCPPGEDFIGCECVAFLQNLKGMKMMLYLEILPEASDRVVEKLFGGTMKRSLVQSLSDEVTDILQSRWKIDFIYKSELYRITSSANKTFIKFHHISFITLKEMSDNKETIENIFNVLHVGLKITAIKVPCTVSLGMIFPNKYFQDLDIVIEPLTPLSSKNFQILNKLVYCTRVRLDIDEIDTLKNDSMSVGLAQTYLEYVFMREDGSICLEDFEVSFLPSAASAPVYDKPVLYMILVWLVIKVCIC